MATTQSKERIIEYAVDIKVKVVELTGRLDSDAIQIPEILELQPENIKKARRGLVEGGVYS